MQTNLGFILELQTSNRLHADQIREPLQEMMTLYQQGPNEARAVARGLLHVMAHCKPQRFSAGVTAAGFMRLLLRDLLSDERPVGEVRVAVFA